MKISYGSLLRALTILSIASPWADAASVPTLISAPRSLEITAPVITIAESGALGPNYARVRVSWAQIQATPGARADGVRYELQNSVNGRAFIDVRLAAPRQANAEINLVLGTRNKFRARVIGGDGVASAWLEGQEFEVGFDKERSSAISYTGTWERVLAGAPRNWGAADQFMQASSTTGSIVAYVFKGTSIAWIATTGPDRGTAEVLLDGKKVSVVDLYSSEVAFGRGAIVLNGLDAAQSHRLEIKALGSGNEEAEGTQVNIYGFVRLSL